MASAGTTREDLVKPYEVIVLIMDVPKNIGNKMVNVAWLRALIVAAVKSPLWMEAIPTPELTTSSKAARVAAERADGWDRIAVLVDMFLFLFFELPYLLLMMCCTVL